MYQRTISKTVKVEAKEKDEAENARKKRVAELRDEFHRLAVTSVIKTLPLDAKRAYAQTYQEKDGPGKAASYNAEKVEFANKMESLQFSTWLREKRASIPPSLVFSTLHHPLWLPSK